MSERRYQEERALREKCKQDKEVEKMFKEKRIQEKITKAEENQKIHSNNENLKKSLEKIQKQTKRIKNDFARWSERKTEELGNEVKVGFLRSRELLTEIETAKNLGFNMAPYVNDETNSIRNHLEEAYLEVEAVKKKIEALKPTEDNATEEHSETDEDNVEQSKPKPPKQQREKKKKLKQNRCRSCVECKKWCEMRGRDTSEWCHSCLIRKREGKAGKTACKLRGMCSTLNLKMTREKYLTITI